MEKQCTQCQKKVPITNWHTLRVGGEAIGLCGKHYTQFIKYGKFLDASPKSFYDENDFTVSEEGIWIICYNRKYEVSRRFLIDEEDLERVIKKRWRYWKGNFFTGNLRPVSITAFLMEPQDGEVVDHINGKREDNRKGNLRVTSQANNLLNKALLSSNRSGVAGVSWDKERGRWAVEIRKGCKRVHIGRYLSIEEATYARYVAETELFGNFRSTRNDEKIFALIKNCENKQDIYEKVLIKLHKTFNQNVNSARES